MSPTETHVLAPAEYPEWDRLVGAVDHGTHFHSSDWVESTARALGFLPRIYGYFVDGRLCGGCSLYVTRARHALRVASSLNRMSPYGGLVVGDAGDRDRHGRERMLLSFFQSLWDALSVEAYDHVQLLHAPGLNDIRYYIWNGWDNHVLYTYRLPLDEVRFTRNARRSCAAASSRGVSVEQSGQIDTFAQLLEGMYARKEVAAPVDRAALAGIYARLKEAGRGELWVARDTDDAVLAADLLVIDDRRAYRYMAATASDRPLNGAAYLLLSTIFESLKERGVPELNMMSANLPQLAEFTAKFNPEVVPYYLSEWRSKRLWRMTTIRDLLWGEPPR